MKMTEWFLMQLDQEVPKTRSALQRVPEGKNDWKPHAKSMPLGYLAALVAIMLAWIEMTVQLNELDISVDNKYKPKAAAATQELLQLLDRSVAAAREALKATSDQHLQTPWKFMVAESGERAAPISDDQ